MYLEFSVLKADKFKTFLEPVTLPLTYPNPGLRFIRGRNEREPDLGSNGAAKSSLFGALTWCLYGQTIDGLRTADLIPWGTKHVPEVSLTIYTDNRRRLIKRVGNKLFLNGTESSQDEIINTIRLPFEVFKHTVLLGQGEDLFFDLSPKEKMDILAAALDLDRWEVRSDKARDRAKEIEQEITEIQLDLSEADASRRVSVSQIEQVEKQSETWAQDRAKVREHREAQAKELRDVIEKQEQLKAAADLRFDAAQTELDALEKQRRKVAGDLDVANVAKNKAELALAALDDRCAELENELEASAKAKIGVNCPTCGQPLTKLGREAHQKRLQDELRRTRSAQKVGIPPKVTHLVKTLTSELASIDRHMDAFEEKADKARSAIKVINQTQAPLLTDLAVLNRQKDEAKDEVNPYREQLAQLRKDIKALDVKLKNLQEDRLDAEAELAQTKFWVGGFKEVRLQLIEDFLQEFEMATNTMLPESGLHGWMVKYDIERETKKGSVVAGLNVTVLSPSNVEPVKWKSWSGGEKHRLRVVGALALAEVLLSHAGLRTNLEVLDEPTRDLSVEGVQDLFAYLSARAKKADKDIFAIDHMAVESRHFAEVITVIKDKTGSYIEGVGK